MTVKELREFLADLPDEMLILTSSDAEGNCYRKLSSLGKMVCKTDKGYEYEVYDDEDEEEMEWLQENGYIDEDTKLKPCLVVWPC